MPPTTRAIGLSLTAFTPRQPLPGYSRAALEQELSASGGFRTHENPTTQNIAVDLPPDDANGWLGLIWILVAMVPASIGGGILQPAINSLITKRIEAEEVGGTLGISSAFLSGANALAPLLMGALFQAFGSSAPFLFGGLLMAVLLLASIRWITPGRKHGGNRHPQRQAARLTRLQCWQRLSLLGEMNIRQLLRSASRQCEQCDENQKAG